MPLELTVIAVTALLSGLVIVGVSLSGRPTTARTDSSREVRSELTRGQRLGHPRPDPEAGADATLRVVWWLTLTIVLLGVGISGSFVTAQAPIFLLGAGAVLAVVVFHELTLTAVRGTWVRAGELIAGIALIGALLVMSGHASSPFSILFALVAVAAALTHGPRAGLTAAALATLAFAAVLLTDPDLTTYSANDALRLLFGLGATWMLAFVAIVHADRQRRAIRRAVELSRTDPLTGLFNRSQLYMTLEQEISRTRRSDRGFCVLMIDLDGLKVINDTGGHLRGDHVLRALGDVIAGSIRTVDSAYRYGGDEFVVVLPETDIVGAFVVAEKIRIGAEELESQAGEAAKPVASVSIGLVSHPEDGSSAEELMLAADRAMYQAKSLGKNQISGNPRPRPALLGHRSVPAQPLGEPGPQADPVPARSDASATAAETEMRSPDRAIAVPLGPVVASAEAEPDQDDAEPDPVDVRRNFATASRSFDPDHQVRRAMDAFFSPSPPPPTEERTAQEH